MSQPDFWPYEKDKMLAIRKTAGVILTGQHRENEGMRHRFKKIKSQGVFLKNRPFQRERLRFEILKPILVSPEKYWRRVEEKEKVCYQPIGKLGEIHQHIAHRLQYIRSQMMRYVGSSTAYWKGSSVVFNGSFHTRSRSSLCLDMKSAFESITTKHIIRYMLRNQVLIGDFYRISRDSWIDREQIKVLARLLTYRGRLRRGSPAAPLIFNLMCERLDEEMIGALSKFDGVVYTHYGDDLCFSSPCEDFPSEIEDTIRSVLRKQHIILNEKKTKSGKCGVLEFPGVMVVRGKIRPKWNYIKKLATEAGSLSAEKKKGHKGFLHQFPQGGIPRTLKALLR